MTAQVSSEGTRSVLISRVDLYQTDRDSTQPYTSQIPTHTAQSLPALQTSPICMIAPRDCPGRAPARTPGHVLRDLRDGPRLTRRQDAAPAPLPQPCASRSACSLRPACHTWPSGYMRWQCTLGGFAPIPRPPRHEILPPSQYWLYSFTLDGPRRWRAGRVLSFNVTTELFMGNV